MSFFTLDQVCGFYHPGSHIYTPGISAEDLCRLTGLSPENDPSADNDSEATVVSGASEWSSSVPSPTPTTASDNSAPFSRDRPRARKPAKAAKTSAKKKTSNSADQLSDRQQVQQGFKANELARRIYEEPVRGAVLHRHAGLTKEETEEATNAFVGGQVPFHVCAERLRDVVHDVVCVQAVPGRANYEPKTNTDVDFVPLSATAHVTDGGFNGTPFELREGTRVAALFVVHDGRRYVVQLCRRDGMAVVVGGDGDNGLAAAITDYVVAWANGSGWGDFVAHEILSVPSLRPSCDILCEFDALLAYWLVAVTYAQRAESDARRYLCMLEHIRTALETDTWEAALANIIGNLTKVLLTSRFRLARDTVMRNFVPFKF